MGGGDAALCQITLTTCCYGVCDYLWLFVFNIATNIVGYVHFPIHVWKYRK